MQGALKKVTYQQGKQTICICFAREKAKTLRKHALRKASDPLKKVDGRVASGKTTTHVHIINPFINKGEELL
jgi:Na+-transporting NADH:ubiquinone oxidoreductase subunit NqrA